MNGVTKTLFGVVVGSLTMSGFAVAQTCSETAAPLVVRRAFHFPLELSQGALFPQGADPHYLSALAYPTFGKGGFRAGLAAGGGYAVTEGFLAGGGRVSVPLYTKIEVGDAAVELRLAAEALASTDGRVILGGGLILELFEAARIIGRFGRDVDNEVNTFQVAVGTDLMFWTRDPPSRPRTQRRDPFLGNSGFVRRLAVRVNVLLNALCTGERGVELRAARAIINDVEGQQSLSSLLSMLSNQPNLSKVAVIIEQAYDDADQDARFERKPVPDRNDPFAQEQIVSAIALGWRVALNIQDER